MNLNDHTIKPIIINKKKFWKPTISRAGTVGCSIGGDGGGGGVLSTGGVSVFSGSPCDFAGGIPLFLFAEVELLGETVEGSLSLVIAPAPHVQQKSKEKNERGGERCDTPVLVVDFGLVGVGWPAFARVADVLLVEMEVFFEADDDLVVGSKWKNKIPWLLQISCS